MADKKHPKVVSHCTDVRLLPPLVPLSTYAKTQNKKRVQCSYFGDNVTHYALYLEKVISGHARLARDSCWDNHSVSTAQCLVHTVLAMSSHCRASVDVGKISGDTGGVHDIVECQVCDKI